MAGTLTETPVEAQFIPRFQTTEPERPDWRRLAGIAAGSLAVHAILISLAGTVASVPGARWTAPSITVERRPREVTRLVAPLSEMTQREPNKSKPAQEFDMASLPPRPARPNVPASPGAAATPRQKFVLPDRKGPTAAPGPDAPQLEAPQVRAQGPPPPNLGNTVPGPPPQIEPVEKPKIAFERPGVPMGTQGQSGLSRIPTPSRSVEDAARSVARGGGRGLIVGDEDGSPGSSPSSPAVPIPGKLGSSVELLSDPMGVDFWPYLVKVLSTVRRNWFSIIPESARLGRQGRVAIQFAISKDGTVPKLVIATPSGADALDRAAVAGISASNPFPPLPAEFKGSQVRLQFVFKYNVR
jgi:TonB family protein